MFDVILPRSGLPPLRFRGEKIAFSDGSPAAGRERSRWHELAVYRAAAGGYVAAVRYRTAWDGEQDRRDAYAAATPGELARLLAAHDPCAAVAGYPAGGQFADKQARLLADVRARYEAQVSEVLAGPEFHEEIDMAPPRSFRLGEDAQAALGRLQAAHGYASATEAVEAAAVCWDMALALAAEEAAGLLSAAEWSALAEANNGTAFDHPGSRPGVMLAANVEDAHRLRGLGHWFGDDDEGKADAAVAALARKLWSMTFAQGWAAARACCWFWQHAGDVDPAADEWWTPAFRRAAAARRAKGG